MGITMINFNVLFLSVIKELFHCKSLSLKEENKKGITETKKCLRCLRKIEIFYNNCPHCTSPEFLLY
jgi:hypothetical protein